MMTTMAALLGALPLALERGAGSELRYPLGVTIVGGLLLSAVPDALHDPSDLPDVRACACALFGEPARRGRKRLMGFSAIFITRPVATILLGIGLFLSGVLAYQFLPVAALPSLDIPTIVVFASRPGADPETMAASIAAPLERRLGEIPGVTELTSTSSIGFSSLVIQFDLSRDLISAASDVMAAINAASADLPSDLPVRPFYVKFNPAAAPVLQLALTSSSCRRRSFTMSPTRSWRSVCRAPTGWRKSPSTARTNRRSGCGSIRCGSRPPGWPARTCIMPSRPRMCLARSADSRRRTRRKASA